jgi:secondary thiamine-phosphate synthase enzyme
MISQHTVQLSTQGRGTYELTRRVNDIVRDSGIITGLCHVFVQHTSASLILCENADPDVLHDLETFMSQLVPDGHRQFIHTAEGPDDMPAHVRSVLTQSDISVPVSRGRCLFGTWQGLYLWEHRHHPHQRTITVTVYGEDM